MMSEFITRLNKTRAYLDYLEANYTNVQKAWKILQEIMKDETYIYDDFRYFEITDALEHHDLSKLSHKEFIPYREKFFPTIDEEYNPGSARGFKAAWEHHKKENQHHHETWMESKNQHPYYREWAFVQMVCDWMAMGMSKGEKSPREYYLKNKEEINLPLWAEKNLMLICDKLERREEDKAVE